MSKQSRLRVQHRRRGRVVLYLGLVGLLATLLYYFDEQYRVVAYFKELSGQARKIFSPAPFTRGAIYDRNLKQLAITMERVAVFVRTREVDSITDTAIALGSALSLDSNVLIGRMESGALRLWVAEDVSQEQEKAIKKLGLPGVYLQKEEKRYYPNNDQAAHLIGFVEDDIGLSGVEYHYDRLLASTKLEQQKAQQSLAVSQELVLTIDLKIQKIIQQLLQEIQVAEQGVKVGAYLLESVTGEVIAGAQYPGFDPNSFTRYNRRAIDNMFFQPIFLPDKFRLLIKDSASFYARPGGDLRPAMWPLVVTPQALGEQLRLWEWLGLGDNSKADFFTLKNSPEQLEPLQLRTRGEHRDFGLIPETATPINLLTACTTLLYGRFEKAPFVVKKVVTGGVELAETSGEQKNSEPGGYPDQPQGLVKGLFQSQSLLKDSFSRYFRDRVLISSPVAGGNQRYQVNDLTLVTIPAGERDLTLLVVVQRRPEMLLQNHGSEGQIEELIEARVRRISILQQVARSVEDVLEPELAGDGNYQEEGAEADESLRPDRDVQPKKELPLEMPDLQGMSLRKSLRILQGLPFAITFEGTGRVIRQQPEPGTSLVKVDSCHLILEKGEDMSPEKIAEDKKN